MADIRDGNSQEYSDYSQEDFELADLSPDQDDSRGPEMESDLEFEGWESDQEKTTESLRSRRPSSSTVQSFMLYTPDEERSVVKKFDRRLVLFVALLYMLSFLDRSSRYTLVRDPLAILVC